MTVRQWIASFATMSCIVAFACQTGGSGRMAATDASSSAALFARHCAACHGELGGADTEIAELQYPRPRAFRDGMFKLASTVNGMPTDDDFVRMLRRGMPGSSMPSYGWMTDEQLRGLARHVRMLAVDGVERLLLHTEAGSALSPEELRQAALDRLRPGDPIAVPELHEPTEATLERGQVVYNQHCSACHGVDGTGRIPDITWAGSSEFPWARDFTAGFLRGPATARELVYRIRAGMPGAGMPPTMLSDEDLVPLVNYVRNMIPDGAADQHVQWRRRLRVARVPQAPTDNDDAAWDDIEPVRLPTAPLWWRFGAVFGAELRAVHDGDRVTFRIDWQDGTRDDRSVQNAGQGDGVALQFTRADDPPMFAMGGASEPVNIWHWKAFRPGDVAGALDLLGDPMHRDIDVVPAMPGVADPSRRGESIVVRGAGGMVRDRGTGQELQTTPVWRDGRWSVVMTRSMKPRREGEVAFLAGETLLIGLAVWNGAIDNHAASKSVTTWHTLDVDS